MNGPPIDPPARFLGWRMVALACVCVNVGIGFTFGAFGTFMPSMIAEFSVSRSVAASGLSLRVAIMGLLSPVVSYAVRRWSIRSTLAAGFILMSCGWALMGFSINAWQFNLAFGLLCGAAAACLTVVPPMALINNWFIAGRGRAVGIAMVPVILMVAPTLAAAGITAYGWRATSLAFAFASLLLCPLTLLIVDRPESIGQKPLRAGAAESLESEVDKPVRSTELKGLLREPVFWILIFCGGLYGATGVVLSAHLVPFALGLGMNLESAALLASIFGGAGLAGGFFGGMVADRIGGARTFIVIAFLQCAAWLCLLLSNRYAFLAACLAMIGLCANAMMPVVATLIANVFGRERFARAMGLFSALTMPFGIGLPLLAGALFDLSGSYRQVFLMHAGIFAIVGTVFCFVYRIETGRATTTVPAMAASS